MARRRYQKGSLFQRGTREKVWVGRWLEDEEGINGAVTRVRRSVVLGTAKDFPTRKLAHRELDRQMASINSPSRKATRSVSFRDLAEKWKTTTLPTHKPSSQGSERGHLTRMVEFFGSMDARAITGETVQRFVQHLSNLPMKPKTVRNVVTTLRMVWKTAFDWGYVDRDERSILRSVRLPEIGLQQQPFFTADQAREIISHAEEPYKTMFWLIAETGIRGGELCGLSAEDVDLSNQIINVRRSAWRGTLQTPKTVNAVRSLAISPQLTAHIKGFLTAAYKSNPEGLLFVNKNGRAFANQDVVEYGLHPLLEELKIARPERIGLHALRHGNATLLDRQNVPIAVRRERLGHGNFSTTMRYTHAVSDDDRKIAGELGRIFDPTCPISLGPVVESIA